MAVLRHADSAVVREMTVQVIAQAISAHPRGLGSGAVPAVMLLCRWIKYSVRVTMPLVYAPLFSELTAAQIAALSCSIHAVIATTDQSAPHEPWFDIVDIACSACEGPSCRRTAVPVLDTAVLRGMCRP